MLTSRCRDFSAGGRYGGNGVFNLKAAERTEKYSITFPTISRRSELTGITKSCLTDYKK